MVEAEEESLPSFVYSRTKVRDCPLRDKGWKGLEVPADHVTQKMETPILYFHSTVARRASVRVDFKGGLISQWYPVSDLLGPPEGPGGRGAARRVEGRELVPPVGRRGAAGGCAADDPWAFARDVRASWLRTLPRKVPRAGPVEAERYLFYRGLGNFPLPLEVTVRTDGAFVFMNRGRSPISSPLLLEVMGDRGRIANIEDVPAGGGRKKQFLDTERWTPSNPETRARFEREARTVSSLNHPHICTLHDVGREGKKGLNLLLTTRVVKPTISPCSTWKSSMIRRRRRWLWGPCGVGCFRN